MALQSSGSIITHYRNFTRRRNFSFIACR